MRRLFKGLSLCGAWSCFDEFNRIEQDVLSVIASYIKVLLNNLREDILDFPFEGSYIILNK
jgi:dynein heavy chain